jgi:hypothetical protein
MLKRMPKNTHKFIRKDGIFFHYRVSFISFSRHINLGNIVT